MSRYSTSAKERRLDPRRLRFLIGVVSLDFGLTTVSSWFLIWLETVRDQAGPHLAHKDEIFALTLSEIQRSHHSRILDEADDGEFAFCTLLIFSHPSFRIGSG